MTAYAYPKALTGLQDVQWSNLVAAFVPNGATTEGGLAPSANGSGMTVTVAAGEAIVRGILGGDDEEQTVTIGAAPGAGSSRIDIIALRLDRGADPIIQTVVIAGTAATSPVAPTLTQDPAGVWEWPIAWVTVAGGVSSIAAGAVADVRTRPFWTDAGTGALPVAKGGTGVADLDALRAALGLGSSTAAPLPVAQGGTGAAAMSLALLANLGIAVSTEQPAAGTALLWAKRSA